MARPCLNLLLLTAALLAPGCAAHRVRMPGPVDHLAWQPGDSSDETASEASGETASKVVIDPAQDTRASRAARRKRGGTGEAVARQAARLVGKRSVVVGGHKFRRDCSGFVEAAYSGAGQHLSGSSRDLYALAKEDGVLSKRNTPHIGDLAFFHDTYDRNQNGRRDDGITHVALVEAIADDGTVVLVHYGSKGVARTTIDLRHVHTHYDDAGVLRNSILRSDGKGDKLTAELFVAWGSLWQADEARES